MNDYERALIAAILAEPGIIASQGLDASLFTTEPAGRFFRAACRVTEQGLAVDLITLADALRAQGMDQKAATLLAASVEQTSAANACFYRDRLAETRDRAKLKATLRQALEGLDAPGTDLAAIQGQVRSAVDAPRKLQGFTFTRADALEFKAPVWDVYRMFIAGAFGVIFGIYGSLKSFLALDLAFSKAAGLPWHGKSTRRGAVAIIAGEGYNGFVLRKRAWELARNTSLDGCPIYFSNTAARLGDEGFYPQAKAAVDAIAVEAGGLDWLIVDTWSRSLCGDENSSADSAAAVADLDRLRAPYKAGVIVVHHEGWTTGRTRGSTVLMSAADFAFRCEKSADGVLKLTSEKMKDGQAPEPMCFELVDYDLGLEDEEGRPVRSAALHQVDYEAPAARLGKNQADALQALQALYSEHRANLELDGRTQEARVRIEDWRARTGLNRRRYAEAEKGLIEKELIKHDGLFVILCSK